MTHELTPRIKELCRLITEEKDRDKFLQFVEELNRLFDEKEQTLKKEAAAD